MLPARSRTQYCEMSSVEARSWASASAYTLHCRPNRLNWFTYRPPSDACSVWYKSPIATPCFIALSRAIDRRIDLRRLCRELRVDANQLRPAASRSQKLLQVLIKKLDRAATTVLQPEREPSGVAQAWNRGRTEREGHRLRHLGGQASVDVLKHGLRLKICRAPLGPRLQGHKIEGGIGRGHER